MRENSTTLVILAGGFGTRMGQPKSLLRVGDWPIVDYLIERWKWNGPTMLVTAPGIEHPPGSGRVDREVCDAVAGEGPLRGIVTALESGVERAVVVPVDMPAMSGDALRWLSARDVESGVFLRRGGQIEAMPMLIARAALPIAQERLASGRRSVHGLADEPGFAVIEVPREWPEDIWFNANEPGEWAAVQQAAMQRVVMQGVR